jgi:serine/threonine protein kinase
MVPNSLNGAYADDDSEVLWEDGERVFRRGWGPHDNGNRRAVLMVLPAAEHPSRASLDRLTHEYELKDELDEAWAVRPLDLVRDAGWTMLVLEDTASEPLHELLDAPVEVGRFLRLAIGIVVALGKLHQGGLVHKDIKPANIMVNVATGEVRLTRFGIASRLVRERQSPHPPETIAGTLAYMASEQTGRMNRSIDSRSDLYLLGVTFYQMLTGALPLAAAERRNPERVFERFYITKISGVGIGMSICHTIINGHGGQLWVTANEPRGALPDVMSAERRR